MFHHVLLFRWTSEATQEQIAAARDALAALDGTIPGMRSYRVGEDLGLRPDTSYDFAVVGLYDDESAWRKYVDDPQHRAVGDALVLPILAERASVQFADPT